ncbi:site-specific integrase [Herbaspirillum sp.]|uniref:site-specific integrase n=1 Tax=Herbaspirillum sp. TaxID=1890675 RepID=UPI00257A778F|nr:site-specific integrase [Herbaspirillum sp.]
MTDLELSAQHRAFLAAATSDNTRRTYRSAIRHFLAWGGMLPCDPDAIVRYLLAYASTLNPRTLALRLTALSQWHLHQAFPDPTATPNVRKVLVGIARTHGTPKKKAKALPVEDLTLIVAHLAAQEALAAKRDNALLQVGYFGGFRRSELVGLEVADLAWEPEGVVVTLTRSKTDQDGQGIIKAIPYGEGLCCPATALRTWLDAAHITAGALFRSVTRWDEVGGDALNPASVNAILERCAQAAGLGYVPQLSSHSLRRGMATSAYRSGADFRDIKRQGGWRHDGTVQGYIEEAGLFEENAAGSLLRSGRTPVINARNAKR